MKKLWSYIAVFFMGISTMAIIALKYFSGDDYSLEIKKIKSKKSSGSVSVPIEVEKPKNGRKRGKDKPKRTREQRKFDRQTKMKNRLIVALDVNSFGRAKKLVDKLSPYASIFKVGSELFTSSGPRIIK